MPRIRDKRGQAVHELSVSPWVTKKGLREGAEPAQPAGQTSVAKKPMMYSVVLADAPLMATANSHIGSPLDQQQQQPFQHGKQQTSDQLQLQPQPQQQQLLAPMAVASTASLLKQQQQPDQVPASLAAGTGWHQVRRPSKAHARRQNPETSAVSYQQPEQAIVPAAAAAAAAHNHSFASMLQESAVAGRTHHLQQLQQQESLQEVLCPGAAPESGRLVNPTSGSAAWLDLLLTEADSSISIQQQLQQLQQQQQQQQQNCKVIKGVAHLILHPSGSISGHFIANTSSSSSSDVFPQQQQQQQQQNTLCLGLQGKQVLGLHSCYRDPEWALLQLSIIKYSSSSSSSSSSGGSSGGAKRARSRSTSGGSHACRTAEEQQQIATGLKDCEIANKRLCTEQHSEGCTQQQQQQHDSPAAVVGAGQSASIHAALAGNLQMQEHEQKQQQPEHDDAAAAAAAGADRRASKHPQLAGEPELLQQQQQLQLGAAAAAMSDQDVDCETAAAAVPDKDVEFEAEAWVQRTGGDLTTLQPADMEDEDTAAAVMKDSLGLQPDFAQVHFTPHTLLAGAAADKHLAQTWPGLVGSGVVINLGEMLIHNLPVGMLDD